MTSKAKKQKKARSVRLYSSENTGYFYNFLKPKDVKTLVSYKKYDPKVRKHILFVERKKVKKAK